MAFYRTGGLALKSLKPIFINPCFIVPSSVNLQVRHAARKGYRNKVKKAKQATAMLKESPAVRKEMSKMKVKFIKIEKTIEGMKPEPSDDVYITSLFNFKKYSLPEAVMLHREYHHPEIYNNPTALVSLKIEINMTGKKSTQFIKPFSGIANIPHPFVLSHKRDILVLCNPEHQELALASGAAIAGGAEVIKKIQDGSIQPSLYEYVIAHSDILPQLTPVRSFLQQQFPRAKKGTLTNDLQKAINRFLHGIEYSCVKIGSKEDFGIIDCYIGRLDMDPSQLEENFQALVDDIEENRPPRDGDFISWVWCSSKPSDESFSIDLSKYIKTKQSLDDDDDDEGGEDFSESKKEKMAVKKLLEQNEEKSWGIK